MATVHAGDMVEVLTYVPSIVLTLTPDEAQTLRSVLGHSLGPVLDGAGLSAIYDALETVTVIEDNYIYHVTRNESSYV